MDYTSLSEEHEALVDVGSLNELEPPQLFICRFCQKLYGEKLLSKKQYKLSIVQHRPFTMRSPKKWCKNCTNDVFYDLFYHFNAHGRS